MKCFEINLLLLDPAEKRTRDIRQYFEQPKGYYQAIVDTINWVHYRMKEQKTPGKYVVERVILYEWRIDTPSANGDIKTQRVGDRVINWSFEKGIIDVYKNLSGKQKRRLPDQIKSLNKYRPSRYKVEIREISRNIMEGVSVVALSAVDVQTNDD